MILSLFQSILNGFGAACSAFVNILPSSPFIGFYNLTLDNKYLGFLASIIPISEILATCEVWLVAIALFYLYMIILRWLKAIE